MSGADVSQEGRYHLLQHGHDFVSQPRFDLFYTSFPDELQLPGDDALAQTAMLRAPMLTCSLLFHSECSASAHVPIEDLKSHPNINFHKFSCSSIF